jgi:hypothetical protein
MIIAICNSDDAIAWNSWQSWHAKGMVPGTATDDRDCFIVGTTFVPIG